MQHSITPPRWIRGCCAVLLAALAPSLSGASDLTASGKAARAASQQQDVIDIKGTVLDNTGQPVIGAYIVEKGTTNGAVTDVDGKFSISASRGAILEITSIGYATQQVNAVSAVLDIVMQEDTQLLEEVVITGFGLSQKKATMTGAISQVKSEDISRSNATTASGALVGKIAGLNSRQADGRPGSTTNLQIRNMGAPLYVIDGVQSDAGQFNNIDFNDIENIAILKDASASIYGVRAANGVIVVTTKKGKRNTKNTVSLNAYYGWQDMSRFPRPADGPTYLRNYIQSETIQGKKDYTYSKEDYAKWLEGKEKGYVPFDWYDFIWKTSPQYYVNANISGGSDKINYYVSIGHLNQDAMIVNYGGFQRTNIQMAIDAQISKRIKVGATVNGRHEKRVNPGVPNVDDYWMPRLGTYHNLPTKRPYANDNPDYPTMTSTNAATNFAMLNYDLSGRFEETWRVIQTQITAEYDIIDGLSAKALFGYYLAYKWLDNQEYTYKLYRYDEATDTYPVMFENTNPWRERETGHNETINSNIQLSYKKRFGDHNIAAIVGFEANKKDHPMVWYHSMPKSNLLHLIDFETMDKFRDDGIRTEARLGWLARLNYDYANKYIVEFSARYDGSWKFAPGHRWGFFPSASLGWRISEEKFWSDGNIAEVFNDFKIRGSYGMVGDDNLADYEAYDFLGGYDYKSGGSVIDGEYTLGSSPRPLPNTTLSWLTAKILDVGFDAAFFDSRLTGQFDFFRRVRDGLPARRYDVLLPSEVGFELPLENLNSDVHLGYDLAISWGDKVKDFRYSIGANVTYSRFYNWEQYKPRFSNSWDVYKNSKHHRFGNLNWGLEAIGQFKDWEEIANYPIDNDREGNKTQRPGDIKYKDVNGDGVINTMDERPIGYRQDGTPILNYGLNFSFGWKGFDLSFDFTGSSMSTWFQSAEMRNPFQGGGNSPQFYMEDTWHLSDIWDADSELIPGKYPTMLIGNDTHSNYWNSTFWKHNVSYIKLRNLEFGYTLPKRLLSKVHISQLRFYIAGSNLFTITNVPVDPETTEGNGLGYPTTRVVNLGVNLKF